MHTRPPLAALVPLIVLGLAFVAFCLVDIARRPKAKFLPRWLWAIICCASIPLGGIIYLIVGRGDDL